MSCQDLPHAASASSLPRSAAQTRSFEIGRATSPAVDSTARTQTVFVFVLLNACVSARHEHWSTGSAARNLRKRDAPPIEATLMIAAVLLCDDRRQNRNA